MQITYGNPASGPFRHRRVDILHTAWVLMHISKFDNLLSRLLFSGPGAAEDR